MAFEPGSAGQSASPTNSGRASPVLRKLRAQRAEDETPTKDKNYKRYASGVERSLSLFDTALQEWADYISFLGRLLKSLQSHPSNVAVIPSKGVVAKRLAQCLNPSLPSGVHQKALEVYGFIFQMIGKDSLARDLPLYLPGLSTTLSFASLTVRAPFLALVETHILKLDAVALRPALKAIILALLPGLEEETSEDFERTLQLLNGFKEAIKVENKNAYSNGDEFFWQCFFLASITSNSRRSGALAYLVRYLPKLGQSFRRSSLRPSNGESNGEADAEKLADAVTSPEPGLLLRCFAAGLADEQILIQRGFLDLLVTHLPIHCTVLQKRVKPEDLERLLTAAAGVVARRDMSLNRRLWNWLLGPEPTSEMDSEGNPQSPTSTVDDMSLGSSRTRYFEDFGLQPLTRALLKMVSMNQLSPTERARPFRICLSLMDRWEIGGLVVPEIFLPVVNSVRIYSDQCSNKAHFNEVLRSASVFFDGVESGLIWSEMIGLLAAALGAGKTDRLDRLEKLSLVSFIISHFNVREEEMILYHAPTSALAILAMINDVSNRADQTDTDIDVINTAVVVAQELVELTPEHAFLHQSSASPDQPRGTPSKLADDKKANILTKIKNFYVHDHGNLESLGPPFSSTEVGERLLSEAARLTCQSLNDPISSADVGSRIKLFSMLLGKIPNAEGLDVSELISSIRSKSTTPKEVSFIVFSSVTALVCSLYRNSYLTSEEISSLVDPLVRIAWGYLSASHPKYHVEAVRYLWLLQTSLSLTNHDIEATICAIMIEDDISGTYDNRGAGAGRTFSILWTHTLQDTVGHNDRRGSKTNGDIHGLKRVSGMNHYEVMLARPLFLLLDALVNERTQLFMTVRTWLQTLIGMDRVFHLFVAKFASFGFLQTALELDTEPDKAHLGKTFVESDDLDQCLYYLQTLSNILRWSPDSTFTALVDNVISTDQSHRALHAITRRDSEISLQEFFVHVCLRAINGNHNPQSPLVDSRIGQLHRTALSVLHQILLSPCALPLEELRLEYGLVDRLASSLNGPDPFMQISLLDVVFASLKIRNAVDTATAPAPTIDSRRGTHADIQASRVSLIPDKEPAGPTLTPPPPALIKCLQAGFASPNTRPVLDSWISFLTEILPFYTDSIFQVLIPLVETLCAEVGKTFASLQTTFRESGIVADDISAPETTLISLLNGLEQVLARGHDCLMLDEARTITTKTPEQPQGFFGNMASGLFSSETPQSRSATANNRLTVLLSFQDAVRICFTIWSWGGRGSNGEIQDAESAASFSYTSLRMRNRARRLLEHLFAAEALECLETVVAIWQKSKQIASEKKPTVVINLLHVLDGSRPKHTIPAIFNAIYSRTNPGALDQSRTSTLTSTLGDVDLVVFLVEYARSLEDDAMDEIWTDCMTFLKDILANPFPHRQTLPSLLEFAAILGEKVDNTNFGEQRRMRKELGDLFLRLLTATFTTKPMGFAESPMQSVVFEKDADIGDRPTTAQLKQAGRSEDIVTILASIAPKLPKILVEPDRVLNAANTISNSVIGPSFRSKAFPDNISKSTLELLYHVARLPNTQKAWKKDLADAFNDARFFSNQLSLVDSDWLPLLRQWALSDKDRMPELLSRLAPPSTAGIVFGVGATSARLEADRKTQLNLRRIATLVLAAAEDTFVTDLSVMEEKLVELLGATATSSPSSTTRADIYMVLRALALKTSAIHLGFLWPIINAELHLAISSVVAADHSQTSDMFTNFSVLQACKLLDLLLCIAPDDFQLHEWLFITDTIDAVYRPADFQPVALIDELSEELGSKALISGSNTNTALTALTSSAEHGMRRPLIGQNGISDDINLERKDDLMAKVLRPFFSQLSIFAFESVYGMGAPDLKGCREGLLMDLFDERGFVRAL